jgi:hypothetical protein
VAAALIFEALYLGRVGAYLRRQRGQILFGFGERLPCCIQRAFQIGRHPACRKAAHHLLHLADAVAVALYLGLKLRALIGGTRWRGRCRGRRSRRLWRSLGKIGWRRYILLRYARRRRPHWYCRLWRRRRRGSRRLWWRRWGGHIGLWLRRL